MTLALFLLLVTNTISKRTNIKNIAYLSNKILLNNFNPKCYFSSNNNLHINEMESKQKLTTKQLEEIQRLALLNLKVESVTESDFGYLPLLINSENRKFINLSKDKLIPNDQIWIRGRLNDTRGKGSLSFIILRQQGETIQCVLDAKNPPITKNTIKWANAVPPESVIDVFGIVCEPKVPIESTSIKYEISIRKIFCISKSANELPFQLYDANKPENDESDPDIIRVNPDTRLDNRILDLRTNLSQSVFRIQSACVNLFRSYLLENGFVEIHTPKLLSGNSEGGSSVFKLKYFNRDACLAQSPQLYKQMAVMGDFSRVFEIGPVFRAENSNTHRHLCEFTGLDLEMSIDNDYNEIINLVDSMFKRIFKGLQADCSRELSVIARLYPNIKPFEFIENTPKFHFNEAVSMLDKEGLKVEDDFTTEQEKHFGRLVKALYNTDYYIIHSYPIDARPFYTMPNNDGKYTNSFDFFMRGEEILSGAQRIHDPEYLTERIRAKEIDPQTVKDYIDAFKFGAYPHGGVGIGLERLVMLYLGIGNVRKTCMFPRDPKRLTP